MSSIEKPNPTSASSPEFEFPPDSQGRIVATRIRADREYRENAAKRFQIPQTQSSGPRFDWVAAGTWLVTEELAAVFRELQALPNIEAEKACQIIDRELQASLERFDRNHPMVTIGFVNRRNGRPSGGAVKTNTNPRIRAQVRVGDLWRAIEDWIISFDVPSVQEHQDGQDDLARPDSETCETRPAVEHCGSVRTSRAVPFGKTKQSTQAERARIRGLAVRRYLDSGGSVAQLASSTKTTYNTMRDWLNGKTSRLRRNTAKELAFVLDISLNQFPE